MDANAIGFADVLPIFWRSRLPSGYSGRRFLLSRTARAVTRQGSETTSGRIRPLPEIVRPVDVATE
jgi:hypothetical protein